MKTVKQLERELESVGRPNGSNRPLKTILKELAEARKAAKGGSHERMQ